MWWGLEKTWGHWWRDPGIAVTGSGIEVGSYALESFMSTALNYGEAGGRGGIVGRGENRKKCSITCLAHC